MSEVACLCGISAYVCQQVLQQTPHSVYKRKGHDLCMLKQVSLRQVGITPGVFTLMTARLRFSLTPATTRKAISGFSFILQKMDDNPALIQCPPPSDGAMVHMRRCFMCTYTYMYMCFYVFVGLCILACPCMPISMSMFYACYRHHQAVVPGSVQIAEDMVSSSFRERAASVGAYGWVVTPSDDNGQSFIRRSPPPGYANPGHMRARASLHNISGSPRGWSPKICTRCRSSSLNAQISRLCSRVRRSCPPQECAKP